MNNKFNYQVYRFIVLILLIILCKPLWAGETSIALAGDTPDIDPVELSDGLEETGFEEKGLEEDSGEQQDELDPRHSVFSFNHMIGATYNNWGIIYIIKAYKRWWLYDSEDILWKNGHIDIGFIDDISPIFNLAGGFVEIEPIAVLNLRLDFQQFTLFPLPINASYGYFYYPDSSISPSELDFSVDYRSNRDSLPATYNYGFRFRGTIRFQVMFYRLAIVHLMEICYYHLNQRDNETYWYDPISDSIHKTKDWDINNFTFFLIQVMEGDEKEGNLLIGAGYKYLWVQGSGYHNNRIGLGMFWDIGDELWFMEHPQWLLTILWYTDDPNIRTGIPFVATTFTFNTDLY